VEPVSADWVARGTAIGGGGIALLSLGWNVIAWRRQGPVVKVQATCSGRGADMKISGSIRNEGRFDAHIERAWLGWLSSSTTANTSGRPLSCPLPPTHLQGASLPQSLPAQTGSEFTVVDVSAIDPGLNVALHDHRDVTLAFRTASGRTAKARIRYAK
jgi:hypothetical protein